MTNRREFLHMGVAALSLPIAARSGVAPGIFAAGERSDEQRIEGPDAEPLYKILFDERFSACTAFADAIKRRSLPAHAIRGDITEVWFGDLYYRWKQGPVAIAGMTAPGPIFCLEMLARDVGMRVAFRADHRYIAERRASDGRIEHELSGPESVLRQASELEARGERWPGRVAEIVARFPAERDAASKASIAGSAARGEDDPEHLVTWVIAPVRRA